MAGITHQSFSKSRDVRSIKTHLSDVNWKLDEMRDWADFASLFPGELSETGWNIPENIQESEWTRLGLMVARIEKSSSWALADWWAFGTNKWGDRKHVTESEDWRNAGGPSYQTCKHAGSTAKAFKERCRRRHLLTFRHHTEVKSLSEKEADDLLDWCEAPIREGVEVHSTRELRARVSAYRDVGERPSSDTCTTKDLQELSQSGKRFGCIYADPPWLYDNQGTRGSTRDHYEGMTIEQICDLPIRELAADSAHLHLWITNGFLFEAPRIFEAWGFEFRSTFVWIKPQMGIGNYWRNSHELLLTAIRGNAKRFNNKSLRSWLSCDRAAHSDKPDEVRAMIEKASPGPYLELFGRRVIQGWRVWGNQVEKSLFHQEPNIIQFDNKDGNNETCDSNGQMLRF